MSAPSTTGTLSTNAGNKSIYDFMPEITGKHKLRNTTENRINTTGKSDECTELIFHL